VANVTGQIQPFADQYLVNSFLTNPALTGAKSYAPLTFSTREQWMGLTEKPSLLPSFQSVNFNMGLIEGKARYNPRGLLNRGDNSFSKIGIGMGLYNLDYGFIKQIGVHMDYAYHVYMDRGKLSLGLGILYQVLLTDMSKLSARDSDDDIFNNYPSDPTHFFDANAGVHFQGRKFFTGFSVINVSNSAFNFGKNSSSHFFKIKDRGYYLAETFYGYYGLLLPFGKDILLEPSVILKYSRLSGPRFHVNAVLRLIDNYELGLLYKFMESAGVFVGLKITKILLRFQFELPIGTDIGMRFPTNQILLGYMF
jgi:type IX secretion system PorP/SprF family membrane protein